VKLLLDTCTFLWLTIGSNELSSNAVDAFADPKNEVYLSAVSAWEINVKYRLGKLSLPLSLFQSSSSTATCRSCLQLRNVG